MTTTPLAIGVEQALAFRLRRQHLLEPATDGLAAAVSLIGAQAQVHSAALLQLRARAASGVADAALEQKLYADRSLVKLWAHRSTLHLLPAADLPMVLGVRGLQGDAYQKWYSREGLPPEQVAVLIGAICEVLADGPHSRMDLSRRLVPQLGDWAKPWLEHSWGGVLKLACALGHLCHGPAMGDEATGETGLREARFVRLDRWLPPGTPFTPMEGRAAVAALLRRYLAVFGPASPADFRKFSGLSAGPVHQGFGDLAGEITQVAIAGKPGFFVLADDATALQQAAHGPGHLTALPLFDPWLLGHQDTSQYLDDRHRPAIYRTAGWISPVILRQGRVVAHWNHRRVGGGRQSKPYWQVTLTPLEKLYKKEMPAITRALRRLSGGLAVDLLNP
ncbi:hypothetical protein GE253_02900 [Niveispirillum sp. SYP-B3756]|uniref:winged helix DNA-binding domain-containing protein n=1 Tax=Niveispirillum sp. SYP-B3756 TaxID=2662178 RepID=UPI0012923B63|nr:winged helix DNA-binding domain-containing protein [Niveispirillum sp. SYP-B3756]MQP64285.1 hypothetical protein [Niveispirillum sp. SYP-B3756]